MPALGTSPIDELVVDCVYKLVGVYCELVIIRLILN